MPAATDKEKKVAPAPMWDPDFEMLLGLNKPIAANYTANVFGRAISDEEWMEMQPSARAAPQPALGAPRLFRLPALLTGQRVPGGARRRADRRQLLLGLALIPTCLYCVFTTYLIIRF